MLTIYNTLSRSKEKFEPLVAGHVGMYVCGPTVYGDPHLGHARSAIVFDLLFRYLTDGPDKYKVRYVRNITDVGHLEHDADEGEDKIAKKARLEQLEPMEVAQLYTNHYHDAMRALNVRPPSIEPRASGHMFEQIEFLRKLRRKRQWNKDSGKYRYAYTKNDSVYFDVDTYNKYIGRDYPYGSLSKRTLEDQMSESRQLVGKGEKNSPFDFALWKNADPIHIMQWKFRSYKYMNGFPGWHLECSVMSQKYLGDQFDIHGGGMDLIFPHHECEIAQSRVVNKGKIPARYWVHNNMITINGQKMGKSLGNFITLEELFTGTHPLLERAYSPMTIRFFMLQAHYRSTLDFSNEALQAAEKGLERLMKAIEVLDNINTFSPTTSYSENPSDLEIRLREAMDDDLNSPLAIAALFDWVRIINQWHDGLQIRSREDKEELRRIFHTWVFDILGLRDEKASAASDHLAPVMELVLELRRGAKEEKNWALSDKIRDGLAAAGIKVMDKKDGTSEWQLQ